MSDMVKVGDIIDGRRVTKVFELCGNLAYQSEPITIKPETKNILVEEEPKKRTRKRKGQ